MKESLGFADRLQLHQISDEAVTMNNTANIVDIIARYIKSTEFNMCYP